MATLLNPTTSKGAGSYVGETKKQLRDGRKELISIFPKNLSIMLVFMSLYWQGLEFITTPISSSATKENGAKGKNTVMSFCCIKMLVLMLQHAEVLPKFKCFIQILTIPSP